MNIADKVVATGVVSYFAIETSTQLVKDIRKLERNEEKFLGRIMICSVIGLTYFTLRIIWK